MKTLTAIVLAKNEENMIADCLDTLLFCDEVIVVDNGSTDRTKDIAERIELKNRNNVIVVEKKTTDFSVLRNFGLEKAKSDYILYVDPDERITEDLKRSILTVISTDTTYSAFKILRKNFYSGKHEWPTIEKLERLFKKEKLKKWQGILHESPVVDGKIGELDGFLLHYTHRNLSQMLAKTIEWSEIEANLRLQAHHPKMSWWRFPRVMISAFFNSYIKQKGWKAGTAGLVESMYQSFSMFITYARLWELQNKKN